MTGPAATVHVAGLVVAVDTTYRQRCAWCGELIAEITAGAPPPGAWSPGDSIVVDGDRRFVAPLTWPKLADGVPDGACWAPPDG